MTAPEQPPRIASVRLGLASARRSTSTTPPPPVLAVVTLGWLEAAEQVPTAGSTAQDLQILLSVAGRKARPLLVVEGPGCWGGWRLPGRVRA